MHNLCRAPLLYKSFIRESLTWREFEKWREEQKELENKKKKAEGVA